MDSIIRKIEKFRPILPNLVAAVGAYVLLPIAFHSRLIAKCFGRTKHYFLLNPNSTHNLLYILGVAVLIYIVPEASKLMKRYVNSRLLYEAPLTLFDHFLFFFNFILFIDAVNAGGLATSRFPAIIYSIDSVFIFGGLILLAVNKRSLEERENKISYSLADEPIFNESEDALGRGKFLEDFREVIVSLPIKQFTQPYVFGLYGQWGEGKTSAINLLTKKFINDNRFLILNFEPWYYNDEKAILTAFYNQVEQVVSKHYIFPNLKKSLKAYQEIITTGLSRLGFDAEQWFADDSLERLQDNIRNIVGQIPQTLLIVVDDIDRLEKNETLLVLKLVRLLTQLPKTIFILSMDLTQTANKINQDGQSGKDYISKIVQQPVKLPQVDQDLLDRYVCLSTHPIPLNSIPELLKRTSAVQDISVYGNVEEFGESLITLSDPFESGKTIRVNITKPRAAMVQRLKSANPIQIYVRGQFLDKTIVVDDPDRQLSEFRGAKLDLLLMDLIRLDRVDPSEIVYFERNFTSFYQFKLSKLIRTMRAAKQYINSLSSSLPAVASQVNIHDFCLLEILKVFAMPLYEEIFHNWWFYVKQRTADDLNPILLSLSKDKKQGEEIKSHIEEFLKSQEPDPEKRAIFLEVLKALFRLVNEAYSNSRTVSVPIDESKKIENAFLRYFLFQTETLEFSDSYIFSLLEGWQTSNTALEDIKSAFQKFGNKEQLSSFLRKLSATELPRLPYSLTESLMKAIYENPDLFSIKHSEDLWRSEFDQAEELLLRLIDTQLAGGEIQAALDAAVGNTPNPLLAVDIVRSCAKADGNRLPNIYNSVKLDALRTKVSSKLRFHYVEEKHDIFSEYPSPSEWKFILYQWATNWDAPVEQRNEEVVSNYIANVIGDNAEKFTNFFFQFVRRSREEWSVEFNESGAYEPSVLAILARKFQHHIKVTPEQKAIIQAFLQSPPKSNEQRP